MLGVRVVPLLCDAAEGFIPSVADCAALITGRTRAIVLVTPNNPVRSSSNGDLPPIFETTVYFLFLQTGAIFPAELLASFAVLAQERGIALVVDETYRDLIPSGRPHTLFSSPRTSPPHASGWEWRANFIQLYSFSKSYCVPGHRLGAIIASPTFLAQVHTVLDCMQARIHRSLSLSHGVHHSHRVPDMSAKTDPGCTCVASAEAPPLRPCDCPVSGGAPRIISVCSATGVGRGLAGWILRVCSTPL